MAECSREESWRKSQHPSVFHAHPRPSANTAHNEKIAPSCCSHRDANKGNYREQLGQGAGGVVRTLWQGAWAGRCLVAGGGGQTCTLQRAGGGPWWEFFCRRTYR